MKIVPGDPCSANAPGSAAVPARTAVLLAAGRGQRLGSDAPKALLRFAGQSLLQRHVVLLAAAGVQRLCVAVGWRRESIEQELAALRPPFDVHVEHNSRFERGSVVTLHVMERHLRHGGPVLLMDADVLYDGRMLQRLQQTAHRNAFLLDRDFEPGDEPVKLCVRGGRLVEFRKRVQGQYDLIGESVGFFRLDEPMADALARTAGAYVAAGRLDEPYEEALRDLLLAEPEAFGFEDVTGTPWLEIDFPPDVERARREILPALQEC